MTDPAVSFDQVTYTYPASQEPALRGIDLQIGAGEYVAVMGLNGAGKTTLGLCVNGVVPAMLGGRLEGTVTVAGLDVADYPVREMSKLVGMVFDNPEFQISQLTVADEIALGLENQGVDPDLMDPIITEVLSLVGLPGFQGRSPLSLSGGQQQRLAIAAVMAMRPTVMLLDEPTSNLDPIGKHEVFEMAARLNREAGMTVVMIEHEVEVMARYADRVVVLHHGELVANGTPADVLGDVDALAALGLRAPDCVRVTRAVERQLGLPAGPAPTTVEAAAERLAELMEPVR